MTTLIQDLRFAVRTLLKHPAFTFVAVLTLALGIGVNTAIFSVVHAMLIRSLPFPNSDRLVSIGGAGEVAGGPRNGQVNLSWPRYRLLAESTANSSSSALESVAAAAFEQFNITGRGEPEQVVGMRVTASYLPTLGIAPIMGRNFRPDEDQPGAARVALIGHGFWQRRFAADPAVLGTTLMVGGVAHTIIGVLPKSLGEHPFARLSVVVTRPGEPSFLTQQQVENGAGYLQILGRLRPGVTPTAATNSLATLSARYGREFSKFADARFTLSVQSWKERLQGDTRPALQALLGATGVVLLIACVNVANLLLARGAARRGELSIRVALGAGSGRLMRQLLTESVLLALLGAGLGVLLAFWTLDALLGPARTAQFVPEGLPVAISPAVLLFTLFVATFTGLGFGLLPAWQATRTDPQTVLGDSSRGAVGDTRLGRARRGWLVATEVALAFVLLVSAGLLIASFSRLQGVSPGLNPHGVFVGTVNLSTASYPEKEQRAVFCERLTERLRALPGVRSAALVRNLPTFNDDASYTSYAVVGQAAPPVAERPLVDYAVASPEYFATLEIPLRRGRVFNAHDRVGSKDVIVINEAFVHRLFPNGEDPVGQRLRTGIAEVEREIVGVVGNVPIKGLGQPVPNQIYMPLLQAGVPDFEVLVRGDSSLRAATLGPAVAEALRTLDANQPLADPRTMEKVLADSFGARRFTALLLGFFSGLALVLSAVGIYAVVANAISQRTGEIGIRMALGAQRGDILRLVIGQGLRPVVFGLIAGLIGALALGRWIASQVYGIGGSEPLVLGGISLLLGACALLACYLPARRAMRVDPLVALRST